MFRVVDCLSSISRSNQPSLAGVFSDHASRKMQPASHFSRKREAPVANTEDQKLEALRMLLHSLEGEEVSRIKVESVTSVMLDNSDRISVPSNLVSGRSGLTTAVHSSTTVTQTPQEKEMLMKLSKIKAAKAKELRESKYFLLRVRLDDLNQNIAHLRTESTRLDDSSQKNRPASRYNGSIAEIAPTPLENQPPIIDQKLVDLASKIGRLVKFIESLENKLKVSKCKQSLLHVQTTILEEGFLSANLSGSKANNTQEVFDIKSEAMQLIKATNESEKIDEAAESLEAEFKTTIIKTTESILCQLVQDLSNNHQQYESAYNFLDSFSDQLESAIQSGSFQPTAKHLPVLKHQRSRSDHLAEFNRKKESRNAQLQRFLPLRGGINPGFVELKTTNFLTDQASVYFNQLYNDHVKYGKFALKLLGRKQAMPATQSVPASPQKASMKIAATLDKLNNPVVVINKAEAVGRRGLPSVYQRTKSITSSDKSQSKDRIPGLDDPEKPAMHADLPQIAIARDLSGQKYWSAGNLKVLSKRPGKPVIDPGSKQREDNSNSNLGQPNNEGSEFKSDSNSEFSQSGLGANVHFARQNLQNKIWKRESRLQQPAEFRPKTGQKSVEGHSEKYSQAKASNQSSLYYLARPSKVRTRSISDQHKQAAEIDLSEQKRVSPGETSPVEQNPGVRAVSDFDPISPERTPAIPALSTKSRQESPTEKNHPAGRLPVKIMPISAVVEGTNEPVAGLKATVEPNGPRETDNPKAVIQVQKYSKMPEIPKQTPKAASQQPSDVISQSDHKKKELISVFKAPQTTTVEPIENADAAVSHQKQQTQTSNIQPTTEQLKTFGDSTNPRDQVEQRATPPKPSKMQQHIQAPPSPTFGGTGVLLQPQKAQKPQEVKVAVVHMPDQLQGQKELRQESGGLIQLQAAHPDADYNSQAHSQDNDDMASYMQEMDSDVESLRGDDKRESPLKSSNKISRFHPSSSPKQQPRRASDRVHEDIYGPRDSVVVTQQRAFDHYSPESPPSTPESPPQIMASRQLARPVRLGLNPRTTVSLKDKPRLLLRYVFKKVLRMVSEVAKLIEIQQQTLGPSVSLTFKGHEGMLSPQPAKSPDNGPQAGGESRKFDFSKSSGQPFQNVVSGLGAKPTNKAEFDIYQPREFNVSPVLNTNGYIPVFSHRSNSSKEGGFLLAVQQISKKALKLGNGEQTNTAKDMSASTGQAQIGKSRDPGTFTNPQQDPAPLVLNKVPSHANRSMTNSSAMKELSYEEFAESYFGDTEDKHNGTLNSQRKFYEKFYIGYFDFKQKNVRKYMLTFDHEEFFRDNSVLSVAKIVAVSFMGSVISLQISYHLQEGGIVEAPLVGMDIEKFFKRAKYTKEIIEIPRDVAVMSIYSSFNRNRVQNLKLTTSRNEVLGFGEELFEDEGQNFGQDIKNKKKLLFLKGGFVKKSGKVELAYLELCIED